MKWVLQLVKKCIGFLCQDKDFRNKQSSSLQWMADEEVEERQEEAGGKVDKFPSLLYVLLSLPNRLEKYVMLVGQVGLTALP